jgi:hypothetical protein
MWSAALSLLVSTAGPGLAPAQEGSRQGVKPVLTVSVAGYSALMGNIDALAKAAGAPEATMMLKMMAGPTGPPGLDAKKPVGVVVETDGQTFSFLGFAPVTDAAQFVGFIKRFQPDLPEPGADGVYEIESGGQTIYIQQKGGWAYVVDNRDRLAQTPADPVPLLGGLNEQYTLAIRVSAGNVPAMYRQMALGPMQMAAQAGSARLPDESPEQHELSTKMMLQSIDQMTKLINEADSLMIGLAVGDSGSINLDVAFTATEGSELAADLGQAGDVKTDFAGFFQPNAAVTLRTTDKLSDNDITQVGQMVDVLKGKLLASIEEEGLSEVEAKQATGILEDVLTVAKATIQAGVVDGGAALVAAEDKLTLVAGFRVVDAAKLEKVLKLMTKLAIQDSPQFEPLISFDADSHAGVRFHTLKIPAEAIPADELPPVFADGGITLAIGFGDAGVYAAVGSDALDTLKRALDQSAADAGAAALPMQLSVSAGAIGHVLGASGAEVPPPLLDALKQSQGDDHLTMNAQAIPNGMKTQLVIEPGFLKLIGLLVPKAMGAAGAGGPPGNF